MIVNPSASASRDIVIGETGGEVVGAHGLIEDHAVGLAAHVGRDRQHVAADGGRGAVEGPARAVAAEADSAAGGGAARSAIRRWRKN